jgi:uncharacterized protein YjaG (DUF416 family)
MTFNNLDTLSFRHKVLFAVLACERMLPSYIHFHNDEKWGSVTALKDTLEFLYTCILNGNIDTRIIDKLKIDVEQNAPDLDEFSSESASYALDTCIAYYETLEYAKTKNNTHLSNVVESLLATIDMFIQEQDDLDPSDIHLEEKISKNKYMMNEIERQNTILSVLSKQELITSELIETLRSLNLSSPLIELNKIME